jgi:hypothetical protein
MKIFAHKLTCLYLFFFCSFTYSQSRQTNTNCNDFYLNVNRLKSEPASPTLPLTIALVSSIYLLNPIIQYEDRKISAGITKEFSVGFGNFGEHRAAIEYTYIFKSSVRNSIKLSYKYDILLKDIEPSNMLQTSSVVSVGAGYFTNFDSKGLFPEVSYGYSIRNHKLLIYPYIKFRQIFIFDKEKSNITDLSLGIMIGIANPFIDVKIRNK